MARVVGNSFGGGKYRLLELVGQGGVGSVYRAEQEPLGRTVALKILRPEVAEKVGARRRFTQEARAVASLDHTSIATLYDFGAEADGTLYLAMEFVRGASLASLMEAGQVGPEALLAILEPILGALAHAHARGVIHRDLKPDNILVGYAPGTDRAPSARELEEMPELVKLVDFGIATLWGSARQRSLTDTGEGQVVGTPLYMSPEQARGERVLTPGVDIYTLGVVLFEGLVGHHPFTGLDPDETVMDIMVRHITMPVPALSAPRGVYLPEVLKAVVRRCLQKRPEDRFRSAAALREALREASMLMAARSSGGWHSSGDISALPRLRVKTHGDGASLSAGRTTMPKVRFNIPLVARKEERQRLDEVARMSFDSGVGRIVLLEGEAGVGKTKLATWLGETLVERGRARWVTGAFMRERGGLSGVKEIIEGLFNLRHLSRKKVEERLRDRFEAWGEDDPDDVLALTEFLRQGSSEWARERAASSALFALVGRLLERASRDQALMLMFDDIQWSSSEFVMLLEYLAVEFRLRGSPLLVVCTVRSEDLAENPGIANALKRLSRYDGETVFRFRIGSMSQRDSERLIKEILPTEARLEAQLIERCGGNPLHLVQLLQYLWQRDALSWDEEKGVFEGDPSKEALHEVPPSLGDLIELRFSQLEEAAHTDGLLDKLLERAAVLGATFDYDTLAKMLEIEGDKALVAFQDRGLELLLQAGVMVLSINLGKETLRFVHILFREVLLSRLAGGVRHGALHKLAGAALEIQNINRLDVVSAKIAHHASAAGQHDRALDFYLKAAKAARAGHRLSDAQRLFRQAESVAANLLDPQSPRRLRLARRIGELQYYLGRFDEAERSFARLLDTALRDGGASPQGQGSLTLDQFKGLSEQLETSPRVSSISTDALVELLQGVYGLVRLLRHHGHQALAQRFTRQGVALSRDRGLQTLECAGTLLLGAQAWERGDYDGAHALASAALKEAVAIGDDHRRADALHLLADVARLRGDPARTGELLSRAREAYEELDDQRNAARCLQDLARLARDRQDLKLAASLFTEARQRFEALGDRHAVATSLNGLGEVARFGGRLEVAQSCYSRAYKTFRSLGARIDAALALTNMGMTALARKDLPQADGWLMEAKASIADVEHPYLTVGLDFNVALLRAHQGRWDDAQRYLDRALEECARRNLNDPDYARPIEELGALMVQVGDRARGEALLDRAQQMKESMK